MTGYVHVHRCTWRSPASTSSGRRRRWGQSVCLITPQNAGQTFEQTCLISFHPGTRCTPPAGTPPGCWDSPSPWKHRPPSSGKRRSIDALAPLLLSFLNTSSSSSQHGVCRGEDRGVPGQLWRAFVESERGGLQDPGDGAHQAERVRGRPPGRGSGPQLV